MSSTSSVREYTVHYLDDVSDNVGVTVLGGNVSAATGVHAIDGPEHTGELLIDQLEDVDTATTPPTIGDTLVWDGTNWVPGAPSGGSALEIQEDGVSIVDPASAINFGDGLIASDAGAGVALVELDFDAIPGSSSSTMLWRPLMAEAPAIVTTDGLPVWLPLVQADGTAIMVYS